MPKLFDTIGTDISSDRTQQFELSTGQFRDPDTGKFEIGGPPPDYGANANRFRSTVTGKFKTRPIDHFDEPAEASSKKLFPEG